MVFENYLIFYWFHWTSIYNKSSLNCIFQGLLSFSDWHLTLNLSYFGRDKWQVKRPVMLWLTPFLYVFGWFVKDLKDEQKWLNVNYFYWKLFLMSILYIRRFSLTFIWSWLARSTKYCNSLFFFRDEQSAEPKEMVKKKGEKQ